jgi:dipeptidyl aminopeptidase/acylaminoacyl peptidase
MSTTSSSANRQRTIQLNDLFRFRFLQDAKLSPDGQWIAYCISHMDASQEREYFTLHLLSSHTGQMRQLTSGTTHDSHPAWAPDSKHLAFYSMRSGVRQVHVMPIDGGESRQITYLPQGVGRGPVWSPDGKYIAFSARATADPVYPTKPYRVTRTIYRLDAMGYLHNAVHDLFIVPAEGGEPVNLTQDDIHNCRYTAPVWSPDSQEILFTSTFFPDEYRFFPALRVANLKGEVRDLVRDWGFAAYSALWTPDGEQVVFAGDPLDAPKHKQKHLWIVDSGGGTPECRTSGIQFAVEGALQPDMPIVARDRLTFQMDDDGANAYVPVQDGGTIQIYRIALQGEIAYEPVVIGERACYPIAYHENRLLILSSNLYDPGNLYLVDTDGRNERQITAFNRELLAEFALPPVDNLHFLSSDGVQVEGWLLQPPGVPPPYPTILYVHGGPDHGWGHIFNFDFHMLAGAGYAVLFINYRGSTGYGDDFSLAIDGHSGELEYADLMAGVDHVIQRGQADPDCLGVCGLSYGGYMSCWIIGHTDRFRAAVPENPLTSRESWYGVSDMALSHLESVGGHVFEVPEVYRKSSPLTYAHRCTTPTLLIQGEYDLRCPPEQSEQFYTVLKATGCVVEMLRLPFSPHSGSISGPPEIRRVQNEALLDWMNRYILGD